MQRTQIVINTLIFALSFLVGIDCYVNSSFYLQAFFNTLQNTLHASWITQHTHVFITLIIASALAGLLLNTLLYAKEALDAFSLRKTKRKHLNFIHQWQHIFQGKMARQAILPTVLSTLIALGGSMVIGIFTYQCYQHATIPWLQSLQHHTILYTGISIVMTLAIAGMTFPLLQNPLYTVFHPKDHDTSKKKPGFFYRLGYWFLLGIWPSSTQEPLHQIWKKNPQHRKAWILKGILTAVIVPITQVGAIAVVIEQLRSTYAFFLSSSFTHTMAWPLTLILGASFIIGEVIFTWQCCETCLDALSLTKKTASSHQDGRTHSKKSWAMLVALLIVGISLCILNACANAAIGTGGHFSPLILSLGIAAGMLSLITMLQSIKTLIENMVAYPKYTSYFIQKTAPQVMNAICLIGIIILPVFMQSHLLSLHHAIPMLTACVLGMCLFTALSIAQTKPKTYACAEVSILNNPWHIRDLSHLCQTKKQTLEASAKKDPEYSQWLSLCAT